MTIMDLDVVDIELEFENLRRFLVDSDRLDRKPFNWRLALAENWYYASRYLEPGEYFSRHCHLWKIENGELASFLVHYYSMVWPQVSVNRQIENEMFAWAERHWAGEEAEIQTLVYDWDHERQELLTRRGYENLGAVEDVRIYNLSREMAGSALPEGFRFSNMAEYQNSKAYIDLENSIWGSGLTEDWFRGKSSAPSYLPELNLLVVSPDGRLAAYSLVWLYPETETAEIDPLGTHPEFRKMGLAKAIVLESFRQMRQRGMRYGYIASETDDPILRKFYASFQPIETYQGYLWKKNILTVADTAI